MITITVNTEEIVRAVMASEALSAFFSDLNLLHDAIRAEAEAHLKAHLLKLKSRSPNTGYYGKAAAGVNSRSDEKAATLIIHMPGIALRRFGGTVTPGRTISSKTGQPTKAIALPTKHVPVINQNRALPKDFPNLAFVPNRKGGDTTGYLVEGEQRIAKRGKRKWQYITVAKKDGNMLFVLRKKTTHQEDPTVLPSDAEFKAVAAQAIRNLLTFSKHKK